jgi:hypothetical protein
MLGLTWQCGENTAIRRSDRIRRQVHCEMHNRSLFNRRALDWLDATLGMAR